MNEGVAVHSIVALLPAAPIVGGVISLTVIICDTVAVLLHASVARHVLVIVLKHELPEETSLPTCCTVTAPHASVAVGAVKDGVAGQSIVALMPAPLIVGGVISTILIVAVDSIHPAILLAVPIGIVPHTALVTYLTFIL